MSRQFDWEFHTPGGGVFSVLSEGEARHMATFMPGRVVHNPIKELPLGRLPSEMRASHFPRTAKPISKKPRAVKPRAAKPRAAVAGKVTLSKLVRLALRESPELASKLDRLVAAHGGRASSRHSFIGLPLVITSTASTTRVRFAHES